jgi:hypothetical protein
MKIMATEKVYGAQTLKTFEKALKDNYLPVWKNQLGVEPSALLSKIKKITLKSDSIVASAPIGLSGGFGFGAEGQATPASGNVQFQRFKTNAKDMYVNICISAKAVRLTGSGGAMANALDTEVKAAYETAKWNTGRALFGNGTGVLTTFAALGTAGVTLTVDDATYLKEGLIVDVYAGEVADALASDAAVPVSTRRIVSVDRAGKKVTLSGDKATFAEGFITVQNSFNREITGLGAIFDESITHIYGVEKASNPYLYPVTMECVQDITDGLITKALRTAKNEKNSNIDMILCGDDAYDNYVTYLRDNNIRVEDMSHTIQGGFKAIKFIFGNKEVDIVNESFVPTGEMWGIDTSALELHSQEWNFADLQGGGIFNLMEGQSIYRALLANYGDLICTNPGGCVRIYGCA